MKSEKVPIKKLSNNSENPRTIADANFKKLVQSIKDFPEMLDTREVVVNKDYMVLGGNMRLQAAIAAGLTEISVKVVDWSEDRQREFIIKDNLSYGEWDWDILKDWDTEALAEWGLPVPENEDDDFYTRNITPANYEPVDEPPEVDTLVDTAKADELTSEINGAEMPSNVKDFLIVAAQRHNVFDYASIADYYASAEPEIQALMEKSALVLIDFHKAIELGYVDLTKNLAELTEEDYGN